MGVVSVGAAQVRAAVPMPAAIAAVRAAFVAHAAGEFELPHRTALDDGRFLVMAAHHRPSGSVVTKSLSLTADRDPAIVGTIAWTGLDRTDTLAVEAAAVTSLRTGAVVGVATDLLAPADADRLVLFGAGGQAADQARAVHAVRPLRHLTVVARRRDSAERLAGELAAELPGVACVGLAAAEAGPVSAALAAADLVACATPAAEAVFPAAALGERVHVNAVGSYRPTMRELPMELLRTAYVVVDQADAALAEAGEIVDAFAAGALARADLHELGPTLRDRRPVPVGGRTVFKSVGLAIQDWAIADLLARRLLPRG